MAGGAGHLPAYPGETGGHGRVHGAVAAVGDRHFDRRHAEAGRHRGGHLRGRQRALELVGGDKDVCSHSNSQILMNLLKGPIITAEPPGCACTGVIIAAPRP